MTALLTAIAPYALRALYADRDRLQREVTRASGNGEGGSRG